MSDPTKDPNFSGVKQPAFDSLVGSHARATGTLDRLAQDLWAQLNRLGADTSPALRIRALAGRTGHQVVDLRARQTRVHAMEKQGKGAVWSVPSGNFWTMPATTAVSPGLKGKGDDPRAILSVLMNDQGMHPINLPRDLVAYAKQLAQQNGISERLMLAILWQEQQWYQNTDPNLDTPITEIGHVWDWALEETAKPNKSLGIAHMKLATVREVLAHGPVPGVDTATLARLDDAQLAKLMEENPKVDIALSAAYLRQLGENPYGAQTDKQIFLLYALDTPEQREQNAKHGDDTASRGGDIRPRAENWDKLIPRLAAAEEWESLTSAQRQQAIAEVAARTPRGQPIEVNYPFYYPPPNVDLPSVGTGPVPPGIPTPTPGPSPRPR